MKKQNINNKKGFTIIEVVLVLAIAGLIFLMVFVALPALQRSQRDTQRRDDMARFLSQLNQYQANNNGKVPAALANYNDPFIKQYLLAGGDTFQDPSTGATYLVAKVTPCTSSSCSSTTSNTAYSNVKDASGTTKSGKLDEMGVISLYTNATCEGESEKYVQGDRKIAITLKLEGAGIYCGHN